MFISEPKNTFKSFIWLPISSCLFSQFQLKIMFLNKDFLMIFESF